ncbi:MAG: hypothetical protein CMJ26_03205 [Phycisphaerae bacterium]|nr:hypothetical protein [Phycisphaerae bacterium]
MSQLFYDENETIKTAKDLAKKGLNNNAREVIHFGLQCFPDSTPLLGLKAHVATEMRDFQSAVSALKKLLMRNSDDPKLLLGAAQAFSRLGEPDTALQYVQQYIDVSPAGLKVHGLYAYADIYERNNKPEKTIEIIENLNNQDADQLQWIFLKIRSLIALKQYEAAIDLVLKSRDRFENNAEDQHNPDTKYAVSFFLSKAYDKIGEYDKAWAAAEHAHALNDAIFDLNAYWAMFDKVETFLTKEIVDALASGPKTEMEPLFIVGNPRSGTSLLEQILSMHTDVVNGGEMGISCLMQFDLQRLTDSFHEYPTSLLDMKNTEAEVLSKSYLDAAQTFSNGEKIVTNKSLALHLQLGFLSKVLPSSRAILLHRHPLDNIVSCYTTNIIGSGHQYANSIESLARTWVTKQRMTDVCRDRLSIPMLDLHYESLVLNQREETERILKFLNLDWQEDCIDFHKSTYVARTISYDQVNQKMYTSSQNRWKNYEKHLEPIMEMVQDYI